MTKGADDKNGWIVGAEGHIFASRNAGRNWYEQESVTGKDLFDIYFTDSRQGYAVGDSGTIVRTTTGGKVWALDDSGVRGRLERVIFVGPKGFAVGYGGIILTTDGSPNS
jgi:photosystem II stability/assembly factor-like uncharacterized protein